MVVEAGVEALEGFRIMKPQDGSSQEGEDLASTGFLARTCGVLFPQAGIASPVVLVLHRPVVADGLCEPGGASLFAAKAGDEVAGLAFEFSAFPFNPFAGASD